MAHAFPLIDTAHCIALEGADARRFAQAQFSGDVSALLPGHWQWNAWLTAQGRVHALMHLVDAADGRLLAVLRGGGDAETLRAALARYLLRLRVAVTVETFTACSGDPVPTGTAKREADAFVLGYGNRSLRLGPLSGGPPDTDAQHRWRLADIRAGWPRLPTGEPEFLPPAIGLARLGAVAYDKGCYPGQEIAARLRYRGGHKWRLARLQGCAPLPVGEIRTASGSPAVWILDLVPVGGRFEALATVHVGQSSEINLLGNIYTVQSTFDV